MKIINGNCDFEREKFKISFGFKGGKLSELWQSIVRLRSDTGITATGLGVQSVLWSDSQIFFSRPEAAGNALMFQLTAQAVRLATGIEWQTPMELLDQILPKLTSYARTISGNPALRLTFVLNALVPLDNAAWQLYAASCGTTDFAKLLNSGMRTALPTRQDKLAVIPLLTYGLDETMIRKIAAGGYPLLKIKLGADPDGDGDQGKMLEWDCRRLTLIHRNACALSTPYSADGHIFYYLDANGRYDSPARLMALIDHAEKIGALERILLLEEPFSEDKHFDVSDFPVPIAADESAHSEQDVAERIALGYRVIALKPIAKTMSMSLKMATVAARHQGRCFCADLTVNPLMVEWNKAVASRLPSLPGLRIGVMETNGGQFYTHWRRMCSYHPGRQQQWCSPRHGVFHLDDDFYACSGKIFTEPEHYSKLLEV